MRTVNDILDLSTDREIFGVRNSMDAFKGTSFRFLEEWAPNMHYYNDEYLIDCVSYNGNLWVCRQTHHSSNEFEPGTNSTYWKLAVKKGRDGIDGGTYVPAYESGFLHFKLIQNPTDSDLGPFDLTVDFKIIDGEVPYIGWSYDRVTYNKLCDVGYLRNSIHIGTSAPTDTTKIWIDTSEDAYGEWSAYEIMYNAYKEAGGSESQEKFKEWLIQLGSGNSGGSGESSGTNFGEVTF